MGAILQRLDCVRRALPPVPRPATGTKFALTYMRKHSAIPIEDQHDLTWATPSRPMCSKCLRFFRAPSSWRKRCTGLPKIGPSIVPDAISHRHNVAVFAMAGARAGILVICLRCAAYSQHHVCNLRKDCPGHLGTRANALKRILRGLHPTDKRSYVQAPLRPWPYVRSDGLPHAVPAAYVAAAASSDGTPLCAGSRAQPTGSSVPIAAHGEGDPHSRDRAPADAPEEWDMQALADWFGND
jgi:hypothetical protein